MPIVPTDPVFAGLPDRVEVVLPDLAQISERASVGGFSGFLRGEMATEALKIWQQTSQLTLQAVVQNVGIPFQGMFEAAFDAFEIDVVREVERGLVEAYTTLSAAWRAMDAAKDGGKTLSDAAMAGVGIAVNAAAVMPVVGWSVKILWNLAKGIAGIVRLVKESSRDNAETLYPPSRFDPILDNLMVNDVVRAVRGSRDWSRLFGPPSLAPGIGTLAPFARVELEGGGWEIVRRGLSEWLSSTPAGQAPWMGMVPGTPWLHRGIQVRGGSVNDLGPLFLPSTQSMAVWLWQHVIGKGAVAGPSMYCIDASVPRAWGAYLLDLKIYINEAKFLSASEKSDVVRYLNRVPSQYGDASLFGWGTNVDPKSDDPDKFTPVREADILEERQIAFLDTLNCAYVDDTYAAIASNVDMRERWLDRRRQLLDHPARCDVDIDNVPDEEYREALRGSGVDTMQCRTFSTKFSAGPSFEPQRVPNGQLEPPSQPDTRRRLPAAVPFVALGAGLYWAWKKGLVGKLPGIGG